MLTSRYGCINNIEIQHEHRNKNGKMYSNLLYTQFPNIFPAVPYSTLYSDSFIFTIWMALFILGNLLWSINFGISPKTYPIFGNILLIWVQVCSAQTSSNDEDFTLTTRIIFCFYWTGNPGGQKQLERLGLRSDRTKIFYNGIFYKSEN